MKILIATPCINGLICGEYVASLLHTMQWCAQERILVEWKFLRGVSEISRGRDSLATYALTAGYDKIFFIDADQAWTADQFASVVTSDKDIIGGTYCKKEFPLSLNFGVLTQHRDYFTADGIKTPESFIKWRNELANAAGEVEVAHLPTGFMCIRTSVLEKMKEHAPPYLTRDSVVGEEVRTYEFFPIGVFNERKLTEDWNYCDFARSCGFRIFLQTRAVVDHLGIFNYRSGL